MNLSIAIFSLFTSFLSFNWSTTKIYPVNIVKTEADSIKPVEKLSITKAFVLGKFDYKTDTTFIKVSAQHSAKPIYLNKDVYSAFLEMYNAALKDDVQLVILSGTRNFEEQKAIWERKWHRYSILKPIERAQKILEYSSMPSSSRHHWGTDLDLNSLSNSYFSSEKGKAIYDWLILNAHKFGFYQVYTTKENGRTGYNLEKWHWSYLPLAHQYLEFYNSNISIDDINDFEGFEIAKELHIIEDYVNGISQQAKNYN
ncbi:M15 family metallopeptidase [Winogradskyella psychrotolerans]|uniref:M15 family metallopeptidase n=1 Tax=Winogradskyella psychrotolerans TaxID=1344585 RepID=UPI001C06928F|nr:M15 family metallopeptidase [Winogradskyella psychrotolerans]MBU2930154.1 M15 family metallopeptidase [Winogradskyella psychrotolerans]